jgi:hypothetical protein
VERGPDGSTWADFGPDDQLGRINLLTPARVKAAVSEVKEGLTFCLSLLLDQPNEFVMAPYRHAALLRPGLVGGMPNFNRPWSEFEPGSTDIVGVPLGEFWHLGPLAEWLRENGRSRFLLTAPPLRIPGAVGSPANGVATV